jgi:hypothetical protein
MNQEGLSVVRSRQVAARLDLVVACPDHVVAGISHTADAVAEVTIVDILGRGVPVVAVRSVPGAAATLVVRALLPGVDPQGDAPSYLLTIRGHSTWFAPASPRTLTESGTASKPPAGGASIDYLGRDYVAFTAMMRSRVSQIIEDDSAWALDHPADPMTTIIEALAYTGDHLSFRQDAAGTESYLTTARHRLSLRRHGRLRDYSVDDGCNARTAMAFAVNAAGVLPRGLQVVTLQPGEVDVVLPADPALAASTTVFETMHAQPVSPQLNDLGPALVQGAAYTVPAGSIALTLDGNAALVPGQLVILSQRNAPDGVASPFGAQALRLLKVEVTTAQDGAVTTLLSWHPEDALKGPLTIPPSDTEGTVSLYGNVMLADHGMTQAVGLRPDVVPAKGNYTPMIDVQDVVSAAPPPSIAPGFDGTQDMVTASLMVESATTSLDPDPRQTALCIALTGTRPGMAGVTDTWIAQPDLLSTSSTGRAFAAVLEDGYEGGQDHLNLRFGDGALGYAPAPDTIFTATARSGGGQSGRVRANSLLQVIGPAPLVIWVSNPLAATPFPEEESEAIRLFATTSFRTNLRGIDPDDWERLGNADPLVTEIRAALGPDNRTPCVVGLTTRVTIPDGITYSVAKARLLEHAVLGAPPTIEAGIATALEIALVVYCRPGSNLAAVRSRQQRRLGTGALPDGAPAFFNPANWPLGRIVRLDELVQVIRGDPSVAFVITDPHMDPRIAFRTVGGIDDSAANVARGHIAIRTHEYARIGNDTYHPALGSVRLYVVAS